tara:strand:- start:4425 stop:4757 length:333 start_codon:yes stop_codon:yes gene_type:complete
MADLADSAVTFVDQYESDGLNGKRYVYREVSLVLTGQGSVANAINASSLNLATIKGSTSFIMSTNAEILYAGPNVAGDQLLLGDTVSLTNAPVDATGTFTGTVWGTREIV